MSRTFLFGLAVASILLVTAPSHAQATLDEIEAGLAEKSGELERVDKLLSDPDRNRRVAAMEALLKSGEPVFVSRAREVGLFSSEAEMREAALKAIFDAGGPFRLVLDLKGAKDERGGPRQWALRYGSITADGKTGAYPFRTLPFDPKARCWKFQNYDGCALYLSGTTVSIDWNFGKGSLRLGTDGVLDGSFVSDGATAAVPATIPLID